MSKITKIVAREVIETKEIELFYFDHRVDLVCVNFNEGHCHVEYPYYLCKTRAVPEKRMTEANELVKNYIGGDSNFKHSKRLSRRSSEKS